MSFNKRTKKTASFMMFVMPAFLFYLIFMAIPTFGSLFYSITNWNGLSRTFKIIGLRNYIGALTTDQDFRTSIIFTVSFAFVMVIAQNFLAILIALFINTMKATKKIFKTIFFLPNMISAIVGARMLLFVFIKLFPDISRQFKALSFLNQPWMSDPNFAFSSIVTVTIWAGLGYMIIIYLAAIETVPKDLEEQALLEGASPIQRFFNVTLPMIMPAVTLCVFLTINNSFKAFDQIYGMTNGGPGWKTASVGLDLYYNAFSGSMRMGYGCAKAILLFIMIMIVSLIQINLMKRQEVEI